MMINIQKTQMPRVKTITRVTPKQHCIADYLLVAGLLSVPSLLNFSSKAKLLYSIEGLTLLAYVGLTDSPVAIKRIIPFPIHGKIDPFNVLQFALQSALPVIRNKKSSLIFNIIFTAIAGALVISTDFKAPTKQ